MKILSYFRKHRKKIGIFLLLSFFLLYILLVNFLVSAALVPSFMRRLESFERITEKSYAEQVQTTELSRNHAFAAAAGALWAEQTPMLRREIISHDGYKLVAADFPQPALEENSANAVSAADTTDTSEMNQEPKSVYPSDPTPRCVLLLHGYTGWKEEMYPYASWYYSRGYRVFAPDLRCQGESDGDFIGMGFTDLPDLLQWIHVILEDEPDTEIVIHGVSMGAAAALILSGSPELPANVKAIIADCSYTDAYSMFRKQCRDWFSLPAFPIVDSANLMLQIRGGYNIRKASPLEAVKKSKVPTLFIHGSEDAMIPYTHAETLYEHASCEKELLLVPGAGHGQAVDSDPLQYYRTIADFLEKYLD